MEKRSTNRKKIKGALSKQKAEMIHEVLSGIKDIIAVTVETGEKYIALVDSYPEAKEELLAEAAKMGLSISWVFLNGLERVGRHQLHPMLIPGSGERRACKIRRLPYSEQREIYDNNKRFQLLLPDGGHLLVDVRTVGKNQAEQLFDDDHIRDLAEQKAWLVENSRQDGEASAARIPYVILKNPSRLHTNGPVELTKGQLKTILMEM